MELLSYIQQLTWFARRKIIVFLEKEFIKVNHSIIKNRKHIINDWDNIVISLPWYKPQTLVVKQQKKRSEMILLNKPKWFVVSKEDPHNRTIFEMLPWWFKDERYYIWRLDKNSHWLILLTNKTAVVNAFEHPTSGIEKEYTVIIDKPFWNNDMQMSKKGMLVDNEWRKFNWLSGTQKTYVEEKDVLAFRKVKYYEKKWKYYLNIILTEWKKRHIRRLLKALGYKTMDLKRERMSNYTLWGIRPWKWKKVAGVVIDEKEKKDELA